MVDFYSVLDENPIFDWHQLEVNDEVEAFIQNVELLMTSSKEDLLGDSKFGASLDRYLWSQVIGSGSIATDIKNQIDEYCGNPNIDYEIEVSFVEGDIYDTMIVDLTIDGIKVAGYSLRP